MQLYIVIIHLDEKLLSILAKGTDKFQFFNYCGCLLDYLNACF